MHLTKLLFLAGLGLVGTAAADHLVISHFCYLACRHPATFHTDFGSYSVDGSDGCRGTSVPGMVEFCLDHRRDRGNFRFSHQNRRRCLVVTSNVNSDCGMAACWTTVWREVACTWREAPGEEVEEVDPVSFTIDGPPAAEMEAVEGDVASFEYITPEQAEVDGYLEGEQAERRFMGRTARKQ